MPISRASRVWMFAALVAFAAANIIHNEYRGVDAAIAPATLFTALMVWKPCRVFIILAAIFVALPAFRLLKLAALADAASRTATSIICSCSCQACLR